MPSDTLSSQPGPPREMSPPAASSPSVSPKGSDAGEIDLGRWLARDLRPKGAPLSAPPPAPVPPPSEAEVLVGWLARDLKPKNSVRPRASSVPPSRASEPPPPRASSVPPSRASEPPPSRVSEPPPPSSPFALASDVRPSSPPPAPREPSTALPRIVTPSEPVIVVAPATADSLAPQVVPPASTSLPVVAPAGLEEDDLAVLPGRRRAAGSGRRRYGLVLLGLLCFAAAIVIGVKGRGVSEAGGGVSAASPTDGTVALPPPPPSDDELVATSLEEEPPAAPVRRGASGAEPVDDGLDPLDPRRLSGGGPNVRRYADVPTPTLSKLAREQRRLARERDEAARKAKASVPR